MNKKDAIAIIRSLLSSTNSSYSISKLNKDFRNETGMDIPLFGYSNISDFLHSIPQTVKLTGIYPIQQVSLVTNEKSAHIVSLVKRQKCGKQRRKISSAKNISRKTRISTRCTEVQESQKVLGKGNLSSVKERDKEDQSLMSFSLVCSKNCLCTHERVSSIDLELHASVGEYIEICPCEILSPDKFFFHFRKFKKKFGFFMNNLQMFYATHEEIPKINDNLIRPKQVCAVFHKIHSKAQWYRAEIYEVLGDVQVVVNFIDFGSRAEILKDNLKFLHQNFVSLPRQACLGSLANIKPLKLSSEWSSCAVKRFHDLAFKKDLVAGVVYVDTAACCTGVALSFTKGQEIHINDTLVKEGYAEFEKDILDTQFVDRLKEESALIKSKFNVDKSQLFIKKTYCNKNYSKNSSALVHPENCISSGIHMPVFYAPNLYSSNCRLKKMFSIVQKF